MTPERFNSGRTRDERRTSRVAGFRWIRTARCWSRRGRNGTTEWKLDLIAKEMGVTIESVSPEAANGGGRWNS